MQTIRQFFIALLAGLFVFGAQANFVAGTHYEVIDKPVKTETGDKVEVRELFWYYCPHCFNVEPVLEDWVSKLPANTQFVRQPAVFSDRWMNGAIFYYVLEQLGEVNRLHSELFDAIHVHQNRFIDQEDFVDWLADHGVDKAKANAAFKSFSVHVKVSKSKLNTVKYGTSGVPVLIIDGKYWTDATHAGGELRMFEVADYLIQKARK